MRISVQPFYFIVAKKRGFYYYEIERNELLESKMPTEFLSVLQDLGWAFNSDKSKILIYLKNG